MRPSFTLTIDNLGNAVFSDDPQAEVARILRELAEKLEDGVEFGNIKDLNGNTVGSFSFSGD
jgi:hypothetical protein